MRFKKPERVRKADGCLLPDDTVRHEAHLTNRMQGDRRARIEGLVVDERAAVGKRVKAFAR
jgi:hypothetical protein